MKLKMAEGLFILLFSSFVGIFSNPEMLMASDSVTLTGLNEAKIVETVALPETAVEPVATTVAVGSQPAVSQPVVSQPAVSQPAPAVVTKPAEPVYVAPADSIQIAGKNIRILNTSNTSNDSGNYVYRYGAKFLYGHNSAGVFGVLYNVGVGTVFSVTENGITTNYSVKKVVVYEKVDDYTLRLDGTDIKMSVVAKARNSGVNYDLSLMTCYGTMLGGGDATHRLVLFANAI